VRILHLLASPYWSGPAENVALLARAQRERGHTVSVAIDRKRLSSPSEEIAWPRLKALGLLDEGEMELSVKSSPLTMWSDARKLASRQLDAVHCHFSHDHFIGRWGRPKGARLVRSIHAPRSIRWSLPFADAYTVPTADMARELIGRHVTVLPTLVDPVFRPATAREAQQKELGISGSPVIGMVSTFQLSRRHDVGVAAFLQLRERLPDAQFVLVGDGETQAATRQAAPFATFAGYQSGADFVRWLQAMDVIWILGLGNDWSGRAAAQAQACDVRVVAVDEGALATWADAVVPLDPKAIAEVTIDLKAKGLNRRTNEEIAREVLKLYQPA
jgi:glycosyltransferase involved in cell wall biosynthesis